VEVRGGAVDADAGGGSAAALQRGQDFNAEDDAALLHFAQGLLDAGADVLVVHARKAVLGGLSPHENRTVPPLRADVVARLRASLAGGMTQADRAPVPVILNGGLR